MATAHKVMVTVKNKSGQQKVYSYSTADTNTAFFTAPSGDTQVVLSSADCWIVDLVHSTQGSTTQDYIFFNNVRIPDIILTAACQPNVMRQIPAAPVFVPAGTLVKFQSIT